MEKGGKGEGTGDLMQMCVLYLSVCVSVNISLINFLNKLSYFSFCCNSIFNGFFFLFMSILQSINVCLNKCPLLLFS